MPDTHQTDETWHQHPVRAVPIGPPTASMLELIRAHVVDDSILEDHEPYVWSAHASNDREDAYATRMHRSTLDNFAADASAGVAFMNSHRTGGLATTAELPMGRTFEGRIVGASATGPLRVEVTSYTLRGLNLTGLSTDEFIDGMRAGIARDVSVGFYGGTYRCSICDRDMLRDWECKHWPGREYPKLDSKGQETDETIRAVAWIHDAHLAELSAVYDGATPGCMVTKARRMAEAGEIRADLIDWIEQRYRIHLPHAARTFPVADLVPERKGVVMPSDPTEGAPAPAFDLAGAIRAALHDANVSAGDTPETAVLGVRAAFDELKRLRPLADEIERLRPLADEGRQYRADLVTATLAEGARAYGAGFAEETYRGLLEAAPLETVKRMAADWKAIGDRTFPGGRVTRDEAADSDPTPMSGRRRRVPAAARG